MTAFGEIELEWGGELRTFRLGIGEWRNIERRCDAGPAELMKRLAAPAVAPRGIGLLQLAAAGALGSWRVDDVREVILQGLIGGGILAQEATHLVRQYVDDRPLFENAQTALAIILASLVDPAKAPDDDAGDDAPGEGTGTPTAPADVPPSGSAASSTGPRSTATARRSASRRATSTA